MNKIAKMGTLLFAVIAMAAFVTPSMASASNWGVKGSIHTLNAPGTGLIVTEPGAGPSALGCSGVSIGIKVRLFDSPGFDINSAAPITCTGNNDFQYCTITGAASGLPWTSNSAGVGNVQLSLNYHLTFTTNNPTHSCPFVVGSWDLVGTVTGGVWTAFPHTIEFHNGPGLLMRLNGGPFSLTTTLTGTYADAQHTLTLT